MRLILAIYARLGSTDRGLCVDVYRFRQHLAVLSYNGIDYQQCLNSISSLFHCF